MEGVTFSLMDCLEVITELGIEAKQIRASGGGGNSKLWRQMQADVFQKEVVTQPRRKAVHWVLPFLQEWERGFIKA